MNVIKWALISYSIRFLIYFKSVLRMDDKIHILFSWSRDVQMWVFVVMYTVPFIGDRAGCTGASMNLRKKLH